MALPSPELSDAEWVAALARQHDAEIPELESLNAYYEGTMGLSYMHPEVLREVEDRIRTVVIAWPQLVVDSIDERLDPKGFFLPDEDESVDELWRVWQANDMDEQAPMAHVDALVMRRAYIAVGSDDDDEDTPLITAESPLEMFAHIDPRTRKTTAALKRVKTDATFARESERSAALYLPNSTVWFDWQSGGWKEQDRDNHDMGAVSVVPLVNRARLSNAPRRGSNTVIRRLGTSELAPIIPLSDAANKVATDMMVAAEFVALPLRGFLGVDPADFVDQDGNQQSSIQVLLKKMIGIPDADGEAKPFDFPGANLANFHDSITALAQIVASIAGLPSDYLGLSTDNPPSAESRLAGEIRLIKRSERKQRAFGGSYEQVMRIVDRIKTGKWDPRLRLLETDWVDASTPTVAQSADAAVKLFTTAPEPIVPLKLTRQRIGMTAAQIKLAEEEDAERRQRDPMGEIARTMANDRNGPGQEPPAA